MISTLQATPQIASPVDSRALRTALGQFATGITVVSTRAADGDFVGLTVNSFSALSLEPALILWSLRGSSPSLQVFEKAERFVVNVLAEAQVEVSRRFALPIAEKFEGVAHAENDWGQPLLHGAAAWFECRTVSRQVAGDHCLFIAEVERFTLSEAAPLLFHAGGYFALGSRL
ncbi:flavin reductase family protein [Polaromonas sp.]|uniref:flavin reductase family protein n=1 Tax=Polaromonas sp. TaxID=1869339 RepID=UPI0037510610